MDLVLRIDNREPSALKKALQSSGQKTELLNLPAGDFEFFDAASDTTLLLIERKEVEDLCSSLTDGRFDEQKTKLASTVNTANPHPVAYLVEGDYKGHKKESAINTVVMTTRFRDGFFVLSSAGLQDTAAIVLRIAELYTRGKMKRLSEEELHQRFIASRSAHRSGGQFSKNEEWWVVSLGQIPGIGPKAAKAIAGQYPTVRSLLDAYSQYKIIKARRELLQDIKGAGSTRRLGPKASEKVWRCVVGGTGDDRKPYRAKRPQSSNGRGWQQKRAQLQSPAVVEEPTECMFVDDSE